MNKLIIQIPCYNEEASLERTLSALPRRIAGIDTVEWLIIDDGSTDKTAEVAKSYGVDHIVRFPRNQGLAKGFTAGLEASLRAGADIIVNTDADNQYCANDIPKLIDPILSGKAEIVVGQRPIQEIKHFSPLKKFLESLGSRIVCFASNTDIPDAPSGFRAISRDAAMRLNVFSEYTYTLEMIIQAGQKNMAITSVPIDVNEDLRPSRLVKSIPSYIQKSILTILRIFITYRPFQVFTGLSIVFGGIGFLIGVRFLYFYLGGAGGMGHVQSLILASLLITLGGGFFVLAFLADLISVNRKLLEKLDWRLQKLEEKLPQKHERTNLP
jgi:glycosyltransferase involved in cell wall biosynthesis